MRSVDTEILHSYAEDHSFQPSHHIPYLYALARAASIGQERLREIVFANYNNSVDGLSGVSYF